jgi:hypothetical protein
MGRESRQNLLLALAACAVALLIVELGGRLLLKPDRRAYGLLLGAPLPPIRIVGPTRPPDGDRNAWYDHLVVDGRRITVGDLRGYYRYDDSLGFVPLENARSANGWWQANDIGARELVPTPRARPPGKTRYLLVGDSFAYGSRIPYEDTWATQAETLAPRLDVVNLAVDGYSMGQAYLRYDALKDRLEHDGVLLMFVPAVDLWRDVNTIRDLGEFWNVNIVMPRFVLNGSTLELVPSPYTHPADVYLDNRDGLSARLRDHLRRYDRFYSRSMYETNPLLDNFLSYKICAAAWGRVQRKLILHGLRKPGSEALSVSRAIFRRMQDEASAESHTFKLLILPALSDLQEFARDERRVADWQAMVEFVCEGIRNCIDLGPALRVVPLRDFDSGYDGTHFGPRANRVIAKAVLKSLDLHDLPLAPNENVVSPVDAPWPAGEGR